MVPVADQLNILTVRDAKRLIQEKALRDEIEAELGSRAVRNRQTSHETARDSEALVCGATGFGFAFDDFVRYMLWEDIDSPRNNVEILFDYR